MRFLSVSAARNSLPSLLDDEVAKHETIIISRKGKLVAQLTNIPSDTYQKESVCFPLRSVSKGFNVPDVDLWKALER